LTKVAKCTTNIFLIKTSTVNVGLLKLIVIRFSGPELETYRGGTKIF